MRQKITPEYRAKVMEMHHGGLSDYKIARILGASRSRIRNILIRDALGHKKLKRRDGLNMPVDIRPAITPGELADRDKRMSIAPRDLTALLCGDPLPGYSALERVG